ncbi:unnamed protein product [Ambrosiozyma monospora]|uniref:Unnamed protein product n=1 Tax=Ambrosiozyma monospora TaxID=43982 RepID=A0ACB5TDK6_AMBMO|nr:unnamed protein product [Ambrosiozyma monospora]
MYLEQSTKDDFSVLKNTWGQLEVDSYPKAHVSNEKYPTGLYLDEVSDPYNVGAILRSAYFMGVDFIVMSERNCARLSPVVLKASSGAMELMPIFTCAKPLAFFDTSRTNGWTIVSTVAPGSKGNGGARVKVLDTEDLGKVSKGGPVLLVVGSEATGIRKNLVSRSDFVVGLQSDRIDVDESVDSLNVSVATALLISKLLS